MPKKAAPEPARPCTSRSCGRSTCLARWTKLRIRRKMRLALPVWANARAPAVPRGRWTMTSDPRECFVYVALPGHADLVTAGRFVASVDRHDVALGRFVYGRQYLERADAVAIDPLELKLDTRVFETRRLKGVFGALRDAGPDYWGRRIIEKHAGKPQL